MDDKILEKLIDIELKVNEMERRQKKMDIKLDRIEEKVDSMYNSVNGKIKWRDFGKQKGRNISSIV